MARSTKGNTKPADAQPAAAEAKTSTAKQPAAQSGGVNLRMLAEKLGVTSEKSLRARIRRVQGGPQVGRGGRYHWDSWNDKDLKELISKLQATKEAPASA